MTDNQWEILKNIVNGKQYNPLPTGFIVDSPWIPSWYGVNILDYYTSDEIWLKSNLLVLKTFPDVLFLPGFWSEYGMCTEPSAFGAKVIFWKNDFPFPGKIMQNTDGIDLVNVPNPETDGLLPFVLNRLKRLEPAIHAIGHKIRFSVSRGPLNIATFLMGTNEFLTAMMLEPEKIHKLLRMITEFLKSWHSLQRTAIPSIDGILILDDIVGFIGEKDFVKFCYPYFKEIYDTDVSIKFFHNDADCRVSVRYYSKLGINLFNPGIHVSVNELKKATDNRVTILGNIPPRDVLSQGTPEEVATATRELIGGVEDKTRFIPSCGGGVPPGVSTENINAFINAVKEEDLTYH
jgi:uroporphyrinogen-III decarboxylase